MRTTSARLLTAAAALLILATPAHAASVPGSIVASDAQGKLSAVDPATGRAKSLPSPLFPRGSADFHRSPDGRSLFSAFADAQGTWVARYSIASGTTERIGPFPIAASYAGGLAIAPGGRQVALATFVTGTTPEGYVHDGPLRLDVADLGSRAITPVVAPIEPVQRTGPYVFGDPWHRPDWIQLARWSPDGRRLAYVHRHRWEVSGAPAGDQPFERLMLAGSDGAPPRILAEGLEDAEGAATWAPNGRQLAILTHGALELVDAATGARRTLARGRVTSPLFSTGGRYLAYITFSGGKAKLRIRALSSGRTVTVSKLRMTFLGASLSWSPRRDELATCDGRNGISVVSAAGKVRRLGLKRLCDPVWAPGPSING